MEHRECDPHDLEKGNLMGRQRAPKPGGIFEAFTPEGYSITETCTCGHCQAIIDVHRGASGPELPAICYNCQKFICPRCRKLDVCTPWEKQMEIQEARARLFKDIGL
jgi:hypothetical protein